MRKAVYPGSFDPLTNGHLDILQRGARLFDQLVIAILQNGGKQPLFSVAERREMIAEAVADIPNVAVEQFEGLLIGLEPNIVLRGIRTFADYEFEQQMAVLNRQMRPDLETVFLMASPAHAAISSRVVKEIAGLGGDVSAFVPPAIAQRLKGKFSAR